MTAKAFVLVAVLSCAAACTPATEARVSPGPGVSPSASLGACSGAIPPALAEGRATLPANESGVRLTLFFATHTHGALIRPDGVTFAHYAGLVGQLRGSLPDPTRSLFVGNGDDITGMLCGADTRGMHVIDAFNAGGLDADTFGFNEVASDVSGIDVRGVRALVGASRFSWVSANVLELDGSDVFAKEQGARRWIVRDVGGVRVGITGLIVPEPAPGFTPPSYGRDLKVIDPVEAMRAVLPAMRREGAQVIIVLSHMDAQTMERVAASVQGIDAILGSHIGLFSASRVVDGTVLADGHDNMGQIGQLDLLVRDGRVTGHAFSVHTVSARAPQDKAVSAALARSMSKP